MLETILTYVFTGSGIAAISVLATLGYTKKSAKADADKKATEAQKADWNIHNDQFEFVMEKFYKAQLEYIKQAEKNRLYIETLASKDSLIVKLNDQIASLSDKIDELNKTVEQLTILVTILQKENLELKTAKKLM